MGKNQEYNYIQTTQSLKFSKRNDVYFWKFMIGRSFWRKVIKNIWIYGTGGWNNTYSVFKRESPNGVKYWFGSSWWCLNENMISWMIEYLDKNSEYIKFFNNCLCADECFFQTLVMNSPYSNSVVDYPYYIDWEEGKSSPKVLRMKDFEKLSCSDKMMARKFDMDVDEEILDALDDISKHC